jgi:rRNA-processing protein Efg1
VTEHQKAQRHLKKAKRELAEAGENGTDATYLKKRLEEATLHMAYITYYPLEKKYVAIWSQKADTQGRGDPAMMTRVKEMMDQEKLEDLKNELTIHEEILFKGDTDETRINEPKAREDNADDFFE